MTTIFLVVLGVMLAGATALFLIFYGGGAYNEGTKRAEAARLVSEGQQISNAIELYYRQEGQMPGVTPTGLDGVVAMQELQDRKYLSHLPIGARLFAQSEWKMEYGNQGMVYSRVGASTDEDVLDVCREARKQLQYDDYQTVYKCDGSDYSDPAWHGKGTLPDREPCCIR